MLITKIISLITFIPWILYYIEIMLYRINIIEKENLNKEKYFKYINKNFFKSINIKELVLFCIYMCFYTFQNQLVLELLFSAIYIYLLVDFFFVYANDCTKIKNKSLMILSVILVILLNIFFITTNHLFITYNIMFTLSILSSFVVYIFTKIIKIFKK